MSKDNEKFFLSKEEELNRIEQINDSIKTLENEVQLINDENYSVDIIVFGQKVIEPMVILCLEKEGYKNDFKTFGQVIRFCRTEKILPKNGINFLETIRIYRNEMAHGPMPTYNLIKTYLEALNYFLLWFNEFYSQKYDIENPFEIKELSSLIQSLPIDKDSLMEEGGEVLISEEIEDPFKEINEAKRLKDEIQRLEENITNLKMEIAILEKEKKTIEIDTENIGEKLSNLPNIDVNEFEQKYQELEKIIQLSYRYNEFKKSLGNDYEKLQHKIDSLDENSNERKYYENQLREIENRINEAEYKIKALEEERERIEIMLKFKDAIDYEQIKDETKNLEQNKELLKIKTAALHKKKYELKFETKNLQKRIDLLGEKYNSKIEPKNEENIQKIKKLESPLKSYDVLFSIPPEFSKKETNLNTFDTLNIETKDLEEQIKTILEPEAMQLILKFIDIEIGKKMDILTKLINAGNENLSQQIRENTEITRGIDKKLDTLIRKMDNAMEAQQSIIQRQIDDANDNEERIERILKNFTEEYVANINQEYQNNISKKEVYENKRGDLIDSLEEEAWNKLSEKSQTYLVTSKVMFDDLEEIGDISDFSGVCILVTKALELEMFNRFYTDFLEYLNGKYGEDYLKYHSSLIHKKYNRYGEDEISILRDKNFSLGRVVYLLSPKKNYRRRDYKIKHDEKVLLDFCKDRILSNQPKEEIINKLDNYANRIDEITTKYRNPSAHRNAIQKVNAEECFNLVLDVEKLLKKMLDSFDY